MLTPTTLPVAAAGFCARCDAMHRLWRTPEAEHHAHALLHAIDEHGRFDFVEPTVNARFSLDNVYASRTSGGKMLGVLLCSDGTILRAFSGMLGGTWHCPGWAGPTATVTLEEAGPSARFQTIVDHVAAARDPKLGDVERARHRNMHRALSLELSAELASAVLLRSPRRRQGTRLSELLPPPSADGSTKRLPGGVGECAAPKLLNAAYERGLHPTGLAEIWHEAPAARVRGDHDDVWTTRTRKNKKRDRRRRRHGSFHAACDERCAPILGHMLCDVDD